MVWDYPSSSTPYHQKVHTDVALQKKVSRVIQQFFI